MKKTAVVTIASENYFAQVQTLLTSLEKTNPAWDRFFAVVDEPDDDLVEALKETNTKLIKMDEINIPDLDDMKFRYDIMELNTAIKPFVLLKLMEEYECVVYLDPDIRVYEQLDEVNEAFENGYEFVVTPHFTGYWDEDGKHPNEPDIMSAGVYNFGFFAAASCDNARKVISWWAEKLETLCVNKQAEGIFVDQKWMDLLPGRHDKVFILRDEGYNVAYWNLSHRQAEYRDGKYYFNNCLLKFFHFSGYNPKSPENISKHQNRFTMDQIGAAKKLFYDYAKITIDNNYDGWRKKSYSYNKFSDGKDLKDLFRFLYREDSEVYEKIGGRNPFDCSDIFYEQKEWLMPHIINYIVSNRKELALYLINTKRNQWVEWLSEVLEKEYKLDSDWIDYAIAFYSNHLRGFLDEKIEEHNIPKNSKALLDGVNLIGYIRSEHGLGEACRLTADALNDSGIEWSAFDWEINNPSRQNDDTWSKKIKASINYNISIFNINADQMNVAKQYLPSAAWDGYRIGIWYWELTEFPEQWRDAFNLVDEIWAPTRYIQETLKKKSTVPIYYMPPGIRRDEPKVEYNRDYFGLPKETFLFLNFYDAYSYTSRKNPTAAVTAFQMAFEPDDMSVGLVLKINNIDEESDEYKAVRNVVAGYRNIYIIAKTMTRDEINGLTNVCDASVSLHRAEGLGLLCEESMYYGKPVIATNWSGNTDFMKADNSCLVDYTLIPIGEYYGTNAPNQLWAEPDVCHASQYMERLVKDKAYYDEISNNAKMYIRNEFSPNVCGMRMSQRIKEILDNKEQWNNRKLLEESVVEQNVVNSVQRAGHEKWDLFGEIERVEDRTGSQSPEVASLETERLYLNKEWDIEHFFYDLGNGHIFKKFFKKVVRKLIGFMIHPITHNQSMLNASMARAINELENQNNVLRQELINLQKIQVSYNGDVKKSINELNDRYVTLINRDACHKVEVRDIENSVSQMESSIGQVEDLINEMEKHNDAANNLLADINGDIKGLYNELENVKKIETDTAEHYIQVSGSLYNAMYQRVSSIDKTLAENNSDKDNTTLIEKEFVENKWKLIDKYYQEPRRMQCCICGFEINTEEQEKIIAEDIYGGGKLVRYRCPECGAIVGPNKMWDLSGEELAEEYKIHYIINDEGQTTDAEIETFMDMHPDKNKTYLNYGCGGWSSTIQKLREQGYDVYGFEPYAPCDSEYIITDFDELKKKKFDGVFSHDLLEHLRYPIDAFNLFSEILKEDGIMAHSTACYKYVYEYDRFHLVFYTGDSVNRLCQNTGFELQEKIEDNDRLTYNYIYVKR